MASSFPTFLDGNVSILINPDVYTLHSSTLALNSKALRRVCGDTPRDYQTYLTLISTEDCNITVLEVQVSLAFLYFFY